MTTETRVWCKNSGRVNMNSTFVLVQNDINDDMYINVDSIAYIHMPSRTVCLNGVNGTGNGLIHLSENGLKKLLVNIDIKYSRLV